jgi:Pyruvate/2-oxoacid:ferredoxin oxidoreductase gamma subunit
MGDIFNILVTGVGGQGVVLLGNTLRAYAMKTPFIKNVVGTETSGISQESSVSSTARYLVESRAYSLEQNYDVEDLISPKIPINDAHLVLGLEPLETIRSIKYISEKTFVVMNTHQIFPSKMTRDSNKEKMYPSVADIIDILDQLARKTVSLDFNELAEVKFNNEMYANIILFGTGIKEFKFFFDKKLIRNIITEIFGDSSKNLEAFELGYNLLEEF